jgi:hypothetical protein
MTTAYRDDNFYTLLVELLNYSEEGSKNTIQKGKKVIWEEN